MTLMMNGKEANHLIIGGEQFDKNYFGKHVKIKSSNVFSGGHLNAEGKYYISQLNSRTEISVGEECICLVKFNNYIFVVPVKQRSSDRDCWISISDVEFLD